MWTDHGRAPSASVASSGGSGTISGLAAAVKAWAEVCPARGCPSYVAADAAEKVASGDSLLSVPLLAVLSPLTPWLGSVDRLAKSSADLRHGSEQHQRG